MTLNAGLGHLFRLVWRNEVKLALEDASDLDARATPRLPDSGDDETTIASACSIMTA